MVVPNKLIYRFADWSYPLAYHLWKFLPTWVKTFYFLNCDLIQ